MIDGAELRKKLQLKSGARLLLLQVPQLIASALTESEEVVGVKPGNAFDSAIAFCQTPADVEALVPQALAAYRPMDCCGSPIAKALPPKNPV